MKKMKLSRLLASDIHARVISSTRIAISFPFYWFFFTTIKEYQIIMNMHRVIIFKELPVYYVFAYQSSMMDTRGKNI